MIPKISDEGKEYLLTLARRSISKSILDEDIPDELNFNAGCFVTLRLNNQLRGCIGTFSTQNGIVETIKEMSLAAAFSDTRFKPINKGEFDLIKIELTILSSMVQTNVDEITIGRDGLYVEHNMFSGVLLPQVAVEHHWDRFTFISQTCVKAGLPNNFWKTNNLDIYRFEGLIFSES